MLYPVIHRTTAELRRYAVSTALIATGPVVFHSFLKPVESPVSAL